MNLKEKIKLSHSSDEVTQYQNKISDIIHTLEDQNLHFIFP